MSAALAAPAANGWSCAVPDWRERLAAGRSLLPDLPLNAAEAARGVKVFNSLRLPDVPGQPTFGEAAAPWFAESVVAPLFGSVQVGADGRPIRRINDVFLLVPKKNNKTTGGAGLMLTATMLNRRPAARFGLFGETQEISEIAFQAAVGMISADVDLKKLFHVRDHLKELIFRPTRASLKITTFDPAVATGGKFAGWLLDEGHRLGKVSYASKVVTQLRGARVAIQEAFGVIITTQSDEPPAGFFKEELAFARGVRDGTVLKPGYLPLLYEFPPEVQADKREPWRATALWRQVLPSLGRPVSLEILESDYAAARQKGEKGEREWLSQHLNIEIGVAVNYDGWEGAAHWEAAETEPLPLDEFLALCDCVTAGGDGGGLDDLLGLTLIGRLKDGSGWISWSRAWCDANVLKLRPAIAGKLQELHDAGDLRIIDRLGEDVAEFADILEQVHLSGLLPEQAGIGLDPVGVAAIVDELHARGIPTETIVSVPQGYRLSGTIKGAARKLADGTLRPMRQAMMRWCAGNARTELRGNALLVTKQISGQSKIDPLIALFNAFDLMARNPEAANGPSIYERTDVLVLDEAAAPEDEGFALV